MVEVDGPGWRSGLKYVTGVLLAALYGGTKRAECLSASPGCEWPVRTAAGQASVHLALVPARTPSRSEHMRCSYVTGSAFDTLRQVQ